MSKKRFIVFARKYGQPELEGSFSSHVEAMVFLLGLHCDWYQIIDTITHKITLQGERT